MIQNASSDEMGSEAMQIGIFSIEVWCTIFEKEIMLLKEDQNMNTLIKSSNWQSIAQMLLNGLISINIDQSDTSIDDETDMNLFFKCNEALQFLTHIIGEQVLEITFSFVQQLLEHSEG